jgi:hypothetical protein
MKQIIIKEIKNKDGVTTTFESNGYSDFEMIGALTYYRDAFQVTIMRKADKKEVFDEAISLLMQTTEYEASVKFKEKVDNLIRS